MNENERKFISWREATICHDDKIFWRQQVFDVDLKKEGDGGGEGCVMLIFIKTGLKSNIDSCHVRSHFGFKKLFLFLIFREGSKVVCV